MTSPQKRKCVPGFEKDIEKGPQDESLERHKIHKKNSGFRHLVVLALLVALAFFGCVVVKNVQEGKESNIVDMHKFLDHPNSFLSSLQLIGLEDDRKSLRVERISASNVVAALSGLQGGDDERIIEESIHSLTSSSALATPSRFVDYDENKIDLQHDIKEMLLVSPVTILLSDEPEDLEQSRFMEIIFGALSINPEPRIVNLRKHPHCNQIVEYLRRFSRRVEGLGLSSEHSDEVKDAKSDFPRLFMGGLPLGKYSEIIEMYQQEELVLFLQEHGKGLVSVAFA